MLDLFDASARTLGMALVSASIQGSVAVAVVWGACRLLGSRHPAVAAALWWLVALKFLLTLLLPATAVSVPVLPAVRPPAANHAAWMPEAALPADPISSTGVWIGGGPAPVPAVETRTSWWVLLATGSWAAGVLWHLARLVVAGRRMRWILARSTPHRHDDRLYERLARQIGLARTPPILVSADIATPQVVGLLKPHVLLPQAMLSFSGRERAMAVCHELVHVRRRDTPFGWIPMLAERVFFFHPLARFAAREYLAAREMACDAALVGGLSIEPPEYGQLLVRLGVPAGAASTAVAGASVSSTMLNRRLRALTTPGGRSSSRVRWAVAVAGVCAVVPLRPVAWTDASIDTHPPPVTIRVAAAPARPATETLTPVAEAATSPLAVISAGSASYRSDGVEPVRPANGEPSTLRSSAQASQDGVALPAVAAGPPRAPGLSFDTVDLSDSDSLGATSFALQPHPDRRGGVLTIRNATAAQLIAWAYYVASPDTLTGPDWVHASRFDLTADFGGIVSAEGLRGMMRRLLEERFAVVVGVEERDVPVYRLVVARDDGQLGPAVRPGDNCSGREPISLRIAPRGMSPVHGHCIGIGWMASLATRQLGVPVVDNTNISGNWNYWFYYAPEPGEVTIEPLLGEIPADLQHLVETLAPLPFQRALEVYAGLRLEPDRGVARVTVIQSIAAAPPSVLRTD